MKTLTSVEFNALLREDFCSFVQRCFHELYPSTAFTWNWHVELMAAKLADCVRGKIRRLIINVPPRHLKSLCASIALPAWYLGHNPAAQILCASYGMDLAEKLARDCRSIMTSPFYARAFSTRLSPQKQSAHELETTAGGFRFATSVGGPLTGRGGDMIILDDPLKADEAYSDVQRRTGNSWYDQALLSRLNNREIGCIIIVTQRLHEDDLVGHVLGRESWEVISLPAIAEQDETHIIGTPQGEVRFHRNRGEAIHPARESRGAFDSTRTDVGRIHLRSAVAAGAACPQPGFYQRGMVQAVQQKPNAGIIRRDRAELGHRQQGGAGLQFLGLHDLGRAQRTQLSSRRLARARRLWRPQARRAQPSAGVSCKCYSR